MAKVEAVMNSRALTVELLRDGISRATKSIKFVVDEE